jgi:hypothetical protein
MYCREAPQAAKAVRVGQDRAELMATGIQEGTEHVGLELPACERHFGQSSRPVQFGRQEADAPQEASPRPRRQVDGKIELDDFRHRVAEQVGQV